jgi:hypothetical protein
MEATTNFELAVYLALFSGLFFILALLKLVPRFWHRFQEYKLERPKTELMIAFGLVGLLIVLSTGFYYLDNTFKKITSNIELKYFIKIALVYSPIWIYLIIKKQSLETCYISFERIIPKLIIGIAAAFFASFVFFLIRGNVHSYGEYLSSACEFRFVDLLQTFLEGFVLGFLL